MQQWDFFRIRKILGREGRKGMEELIAGGNDMSRLYIDGRTKYEMNILVVGPSTI